MIFAFLRFQHIPYETGTLSPSHRECVKGRKIIDDDDEMTTKNRQNCSSNAKTHFIVCARSS